ncbi:hypothetical protein Ptr86124_009823 [Pyrenophora tritici-repentis]|nr:hypothetical protein Ptr86124_009823 [Pyrenophora tritici-repentis]
MVRVSRRPRVVDVESESEIERNVPVPRNAVDMEDSREVNESGQTGFMAASAAVLEGHTDLPGADTGGLLRVVVNHPDDFRGEGTAREARKVVMANARKNRPWSTSSGATKKALDGSRLSPDRPDSTIERDRNITGERPAYSLSRNSRSDHGSRSVLSAQTLLGTDTKEEIQQERAIQVGWSENDYPEPSIKETLRTRPSMITTRLSTGEPGIERMEDQISRPDSGHVERKVESSSGSLGVISLGHSDIASTVAAEDGDDGWVSPVPVPEILERKKGIQRPRDEPDSLILPALGYQAERPSKEEEGREPPNEPTSAIAHTKTTSMWKENSGGDLRHSKMAETNRRKESYRTENRRGEVLLGQAHSTFSEITRRTGASFHESVSESEIDYSSDEEIPPSDYDSYMYPSYRPTLRSRRDLSIRRRSAEEIKKSDRRKDFSSSRSTSYAQTHQINDTSVPTEEQRRISPPASAIDTSSVEETLASIPSDSRLEQEVDMVQFWKCRRTILRTLFVIHHCEFLGKKQSELIDSNEAKEAEQVVLYDQLVKAMDMATKDMKIDKEIRSEEEVELWWGAEWLAETELLSRPEKWREAEMLTEPIRLREQERLAEAEKLTRSETWTEAGDAKRPTEVLGKIDTTQEREEKETDHITVARDRAKNEFVGERSRMSFEWDFANTTSAPSSYANSFAWIFTTKSLTSSASYLSRDSGYSAVQVLTATKELLSIVLEDRVLLPIYKSAINDPNIGPERLQRNLRRLFKVYANLLEEEATERLEYLASQLVLVKSGFLAHSIVEKLRNGPASSPDTEHHKNGSDDDDDGDINRPSDVRPVNEDVFEDLAVFREFLIGSEAFKSLRANVQAFVTPKTIQTPLLDATFRRELDVDKTVIKQNLTKPSTRPATSLTLEQWLEDARNSIDLLFRATEISVIAAVILNLAIDALFLATDEFFITMGLLEPDLKRNMTRFRWQCQNCGEQFYSDITELRAGGGDELVNHMQRTSGVKVHTAPYNQHSNNQRYVALRPRQWIQNAVTKISSAFAGSPK